MAFFHDCSWSLLWWIASKKCLSVSSTTLRKTSGSWSDQVGWLKRAIRSRGLEQWSWVVGCFCFYLAWFDDVKQDASAKARNGSRSNGILDWGIMRFEARVGIEPNRTESNRYTLGPISVYHRYLARMLDTDQTGISIDKRERIS